jgi:hypothetical protein
VRGEPQQDGAPIARPDPVGLLAAAVGALVTLEAQTQLQLGCAAEPLHQLRVARAQRADDASPSTHPHQAAPRLVNRRVESQQPANQVGSEQAAAGDVVPLPIHQDLTAPQAGVGVLAMRAEGGGEIGLGIVERTLDALEPGRAGL